jgi:LysR family nitrogen assimilation transcriptional regulator
VDLKRLQTFLQIAELGSVSKVSDRMRIAQPALSRQIRLLEEELETPLFDRHRRGMQLTQGGEELKRRITQPLRDLQMAFEDIRSSSHEVGGHVTFGLPQTVSHILSGRLARRVAAHAPNLSLRIVEGYTVHMIDWLNRGEIDLAILNGPSADLHLRCDDLLIEQVVMIGPSDSGLDPAKPVSFAEFTRLPLVLPSHPNALRILVEAAARRAKIKLDIRFEADSLVVLRELAEAGLGYTALPLSAMKDAIDAGRLRFAPLVSPTMSRHLILGFQAEREPSRAVQVVGQLIREEISAMVAAKTWQASLQYDS